MIGRLSRNFDGAFYSGEGDKNVGRDERPCKFYFVDILSYYADIYIYIEQENQFCIKIYAAEEHCLWRNSRLVFRARGDRFYEGV